MHKKKIFSYVQTWYILIYTMFFMKVLEVLDKFGVAYAVAGGYAVSLHGAVRGTIDIDLVVNITKSGLIKTEQALNSIGLQSKLPVNAEDVFNFREEYIENRNMVAWSFINPSNPAEIVDIMITEDLRNIKTRTVEMFEKNVKIISLNDLIKIKEKSGRPQDAEDIKALRKLIK